jgi:anti-sigma regulatory factor (Ser/Thr protein kinase)
LYPHSWRATDDQREIQRCYDHGANSHKRVNYHSLAKQIRTMVTELVRNAYKHGRPKGRRGDIRVKVARARSDDARRGRRWRRSGLGTKIIEDGV